MKKFVHSNHNAIFGEAEENAASEKLKTELYRRFNLSQYSTFNICEYFNIGEKVK